MASGSSPSRRRWRIPAPSTRCPEAGRGCVGPCPGGRRWTRRRISWARGAAATRSCARSSPTIGSAVGGQDRLLTGLSARWTSPRTAKRLPPAPDQGVRGRGTERRRSPLVPFRAAGGRRKKKGKVEFPSNGPLVPPNRMAEQKAAFWHPSEPFRLSKRSSTRRATEGHGEERRVQSSAGYPEPRTPNPFLRGPPRPSAVNLCLLRGRHSRNYSERSVAASGRTLALVRGGEFDPPPLIRAGTAGPTYSPAPVVAGATLGSVS